MTSRHMPFDTAVSDQHDSAVHQKKFSSRGHRKSGISEILSLAGDYNCIYIIIYIIPPLIRGVALGTLIF